MRSKIWEKILASALVVALTAGNLCLIGNSVIANELEYTEGKEEPPVISSEESLNEISKAKMYANYNSNKRAYETEYNVKDVVTITDRELLKETVIEPKEEVFLNAEKKEFTTKIGDIYYTYYKAIKINKDDFERVLGRNGAITITNEAGELIATIDSSLEAQDGNYIVEYNEKYGEVIVSISKAFGKGELEIEHTKAIRADLPYSKEEAESFVELVNKRLVNDMETEEKISLKEPESHLKLESNKEEIRNKEEKIELKVELGNNKEDSKLYSNPTVIVSFPSFVEDVEIENTNILFEDELKVTKVTKGTVGENKAVKVDLEGTQTKFNGIVNGNGTTLVLGAKLTNKEEAGEGEIVAYVEGSKAQTALTSTLEANTVVPEVIVGVEPETTEPTTTNDTNENETTSTQPNTNEQTEQETGTVANGEETQTEAKPKVGISMQSLYNEEAEILEGYEYTYFVNIYGNEDNLLYEEDEETGDLKAETIKNLVVKDFLPEGVTFSSAELYVDDEKIENSVEYSANNRLVTCNIGDTNFEKSMYVAINVKVDNLKDNEYKKQISNKALVTYDGYSKEIYSNSVEFEIVKEHVDIVKTETWEKRYS